MATGPPAQATGPHQSGAGVGVGMLRGTGDRLLDFFDLEICQDSTIVKLCFIRKHLEEADRFGPTQNSKIFIKKSIVFFNKNDLMGSVYAWNSGFSRILF